LWVTIAVLILIFIAIESILRGTVIQTLNGIAVFLAVVTALILLWHFWQQILLGLIFVLAVFLLLQKIRELRE
jgi:membrane protein implicated in regulation of membrane protease activity